MEKERNLDMGGRQKLSSLIKKISVTAAAIAAIKKEERFARACDCDGTCTSCEEDCDGCGGNCSGTCQWWCGGCSSGCKGNCKDTCSSCTGSCSSSCTGCSGGCKGDCTDACSQGCNGCVASCKNDCSSCTGTCTSSCSQGCNGCLAACKTDCSGCTGSCTGSCTDACSQGCNGCVASCRTDCSGCTGSCTGSCSGSCKYDCDGACYDDCTYSCEYSCDGSCDGSSYVLYKVTLNGQEATTAGTTSYQQYVNSRPQDITPPKKNGYAFGGYFTGTGGTGKQYYGADGKAVRNQENDNNITLDQRRSTSSTLYAKWTLVDYSIGYSTHGGKFANNVISRKQSQPVSSFDGTAGPHKVESYNIEAETVVLEDPERKGMKFDGWQKKQGA